MNNKFQKGILLFLAVYGTLYAQAYDNSENLITDNDSYCFDKGTAGQWSFVTGNENDGNASIKAVAPGYDGSGYCLQFKNNVTASDNWKAQAKYEFSPTLPAGKYRLEFYAKADGRTQLEFGYQKDNYQDGDVNGIFFSLNKEWKLLTLDFEMNFGDVARMFFNFANYKGSIYLDNIMLIDMNPPVEEPNPETNLITDNASYNFNDTTTGKWNMEPGHNNGGKASVSATTPGYGKSAACLLLANTEMAAGNSAAQVSYKLPQPLQKGTYKVEFFAKASAATSNLEFGYRNSENENTGKADMTFKLSTEWAKKSVRFDVEDDDASCIFLNFGKVTGSVYVDRIMLSEVTNPGPVPDGIPYYYTLEETGTSFPEPDLPAVSKLKSYKMLPNPFEFSDGSDTVTEFNQWAHRRYEISKEIQKYEIGTKPQVQPEQIEASMSGNTLKVIVRANGKSLTLTSTISFPANATRPCPLMIGTSNNSLPASFFSSNGIATMNFTESQVNDYSQMGGGSAGRGNYNFDKLYPDLKTNGAYAEWSWGVSRLIDGLYQLGQDETGIDLSHIGVTGCSYAGKMALFAGAFDERIALTIAQEPGGGGAASWRVSEGINEVEKLGATDGNWYRVGFQNDFSGNNCYKLPYDHHELVAMCCPRAVLILGNPDYTWLADESTYISSVAAREVWKKFGIENRMGFSIVGGHSHCQLPSSQYTEVQNFIKRFLLDDESIDTNVQIAPKYQNVNANKWFKDWNSSSDPKDPEDSFTFWREAENMVTGIYGGKYKKVTGQNKSEVSNGIYLETTVNFTASTTDPSSDKGTWLYTEFTVPKDGNYTVLARVNCGSYDDDSYFCAIDKTSEWTFINGIVTSGWAWQTFTSGTLTAGTHKLYIASREDGARIDKILVTDNPSTAEGLGGEDIQTGVSAATGDELSVTPLCQNGGIMVRFTLPYASEATFTLQDTKGTVIETISSKRYGDGNNAIEFSQKPGKGTYICTMRIGNSQISKKLTVF